MLDSRATRASLLVRIRDREDPDAWRQFLEIYAPAVYSYARRRGLQDNDAADLMQDVMRAAASAAGRRDDAPSFGSFRGWLYTITRNTLSTYLDGRRRQVHGAGGSEEPRQTADHDATGTDAGSAEWDREAERRLAAWAMDQIREEFPEPTWRAFWLTAVEGRDARSVAAEVGLSPGAVHVARSRVLARLKHEIQQVENV